MFQYSLNALLLMLVSVVKCPYGHEQCVSKRYMSKLELRQDRPPIFIAAGVIKTEEQILQASEANQLATQIIGSISENRNDPPGNGRDFHFDEVSLDARNAVRLRNPGSEEASDYMPRSIATVQAAGQRALLAITSLAGEDPKQILPRMAVWAKAMGADGIELNGSCPNEEGGLLCHDADQTITVCHAVREAVGDDMYILIKMASLGEMRIRRLKQSPLVEAIDGVTAINAIRQKPLINPVTDEPFIEVNEGYAGQSGPIIAPTARRNLRSWLRPATGPAVFPITDSLIDIWSVGGVDNGYEIYSREQGIGAFAVGGAQEFYRAKDPVTVANRWAKEYRLAQAAARAT